MAATFSIDDFKTGISSASIEPARSSLFQVSMTGGQGSQGFTNLKYLCKATSIPGLTITPIERQYLGRTVKIPGDITFAELSLTIVNDTDYGIRNALEIWMAGINSHEENKRTYTNSFGSETTTIKLEQLNREGTATSGGTFQFINAWPTTVDPIELSFDTASDIEEFTATFAYQYYTIT